MQTKVNLEVIDKGIVDIGDTLVIEGFRFVSAASLNELKQLYHKDMRDYKDLSKDPCVTKPTQMLNTHLQIHFS